MLDRLGPGDVVTVPRIGSPCAERTFDARKSTLARTRARNDEIAGTWAGS
jgi:hypothetical protein